MARRDFVYIGIPDSLVDRLDEFLKSGKAKRMGINNRAELSRFILNKFLENERFD